MTNPQTMEKPVRAKSEHMRMATLGSYVAKAKSLDPRKYPNEEFELFSVPSHAEGKPEVVIGKTVGASKQMVDDDTVLLCKINPRINRVWVVRSHTAHRKVASSEWMTFPPNPDFLPQYLGYYLQQDELRDHLALNASGVGGSLMRAKPGLVKDYPFPLFTLPEQRRIVSAIETQLGRLDAAVARLHGAKAKLKRYKQAVLKAAVEGGYSDTSIDDWTVNVLGDVATTIRNGYSKKPDAEDGIRIFRISAVRPLELFVDDVRYLDTKTKDHEASLVTAGDVLFTRYNGSRDMVGACALVPDDCPPTVHPDKLIRVRVPANELLPGMLAILGTVGEGREYIESKIRTTAGQSGISGGDLKSLPLRYPPVKEQKRIIREVESRLSGMHEMEATLDAQLLQSTRLRQAVLKRAFEGRLG